MSSTVISAEQQVAEKVNAILKEQIGDLVISCARFRAEAEVLREQMALLTALPPQT